MKDNESCSAGCLLALAVLLFAGLLFGIQSARGYHLKWSWGNAHWIWVDKDGKP